MAESSDKKDYVIGVDLGGTKILAGVFNLQLECKQIKAVGIGAPGAVNPETGRVIFAPNLGWEDVPLKKELEKQLDLPVFLENDCNVCTLGVHEVELKAKPRHLVGIFLGTGIGGGLSLE